MDNHQLEFLILSLSTVIAILRLAPLVGNIRILIFALQAGIFIAQMYKVYSKDRKVKSQDPVSPKVFVAEVAQHFLDTHPVGKRISRKSDVDEKVEKLLSDSEVPGLG